MGLEHIPADLKKGDSKHKVQSRGLASCTTHDVRMETKRRMPATKYRRTSQTGAQNLPVPGTSKRCSSTKKNPTTEKFFTASAIQEHKLFRKSEQHNWSGKVEKGSGREETTLQVDREGVVELQLNGTLTWRINIWGQDGYGVSKHWGRH